MRGTTIPLGSFIIAVGLGLLASIAPAADDIDALQEQAVKDAVKKVSTSVVKIETSGGTEVVNSGGGRGRGKLIRRGTGPTTGLIVGADGYVISSAFNFANKPATIRVALPGLKERKVAKIIATDQTRMITLLKIADLPAGTKLPVPVATPATEMQIGLTAIAVGRALASESDSLPSVSVGIISALDRIWGKAIQTDAKISPTNYGGPLIDLQGRVQGVLVPASPQAEGETAGFEWYDSGIGFAIPLTDIYAVLPRMMKGTEKEPVTLKRGFVGITMRSTDQYEALPIIGTVAPGSAADKADLRPGDLIKEIDGKVVLNYAQVQHQLGKRYEGDVVSLKLERDKKEIALPKLVLGSAEAAYPSPFMGILPMRDDPDPGVEIRYVYPKSPADGAGLKAGDRIMSVSAVPATPGRPPVKITRGREQLMSLIESTRPGQELKLDIQPAAKGAKAKSVNLKLVDMPNAVIEKIPEKSTVKKALTKPGAKGGKPPAAPKKPETGLQKKTTPAADHTYHIYVPDDYDANISYGIVVWLHPVGKHKDRDIEDFVTSWSTFCDDNNLILICPQSDAPRGWTPGDATFVTDTIRSVTSGYTVDQRRIVAHGMGVGGEMAYYMGFQSRALIRGVATVGAAMSNNPREKVANQPMSFFLAVGGKDPVKPSVVQTKDKLNGMKYPVILREMNNMGHEYIDGRGGIPTMEEMIRWIDSLDRI